ncbi:hypothetical protein [Leptospira noguchii]|uniref:hypothetical protein n=1 Tax=Leptospira noguchii TaxID=28182 RepID=UPI0009E1B734|nr:hypothetical protein [Leptospira noguchii]
MTYFFSITDDFGKESLSIANFFANIHTLDPGQIDYYRIILCTNEQDIKKYSNSSKIKILKKNLPGTFIFESNIHSVKKFNSVTFILQRWIYAFLSKREYSYSIWYNKSKIFDYNESKLEESRIFNFAKTYHPIKSFFTYYFIKVICLSKAWIFRVPIVIIIFIKDSFMLTFESYKLFKEKESKYKYHKMWSLEKIFTRDKDEIVKERKKMEEDYLASKQMYLESNKTLLALLISTFALVASLLAFIIDGSKFNEKSSLIEEIEMKNREIYELKQTVSDLLFQNNKNLKNVNNLEQRK